jgi:hypothetical protein
VKGICFGQLKTAFVLVACSLFVYAMAAPAMAQGAASTPMGVPEDWSHRHVIHSNPDTLEEAAAKGTLHEWIRKADDPRFVLQLEKKLAKLQKAAEAEDDELAIEGVDGRKSALGAKAALKAKEKESPAPPGKEQAATYHPGSSCTGIEQRHGRRVRFRQRAQLPLQNSRSRHRQRIARAISLFSPRPHPVPQPAARVV